MWEHSLDPCASGRMNMGMDKIWNIHKELIEEGIETVKKSKSNNNLYNITKWEKQYNQDESTKEGT